METHPIDYLILVNPFHKISEAYFDNLELVEMRGYDNEVFRVEKAAAHQFRELEKASSAKGIPILLSSAYRSVEKQRQIKEEFTTEYGEDYAKRYVAEPGYSEHHTGLALDFVAKIRGKWLSSASERRKECAYTTQDMRKSASRTSITEGRMRTSARGST